MDIKILSLHTGEIIDKEKKLIDVRSIFRADSFPYIPKFAVGASVYFGKNAPGFILRFDIVDSEGNPLNEAIHEIDADIQTFYSNGEMSALDAWLTPTDHLIPNPGRYIIRARLITEDEKILDEMEANVLISDKWEEVDLWGM